MAGIRFIDLVTDAEEVTQVRSLREFVKRLCNNSVAYICGLHEWPFLWTTDWFQTTDDYTTGNVDLTNGDATVSGGSSSPVFTAAMVGRKIRFGNATAYYTIKSRTSATELELDQVYTGDTDTDVDFVIYKDEYLLRADVDTQKRIRNSENGVAIFSLSSTEFDEQYPSPQGTGVQSLSVFSGKAVKTYTTGTVSLPSASRTLTGSGTAWLSAEGLSKGTKLKIGSLIFTVNTVDSDTQITVYEASTATISAGTTYTAILDNYLVQLHSISDQVLTMYYRFQRVPAVLDADNDIPDIPYPMHPLIGLAMLPTLWRHKGFMDRALESTQTFDKELTRWEDKYNIPVLDRRYPIHPVSIFRATQRAGVQGQIGIPYGIYRP